MPLFSLKTPDDSLGDHYDPGSLQALLTISEMPRKI